MALQGDIWTETRVDLCLHSEIQLTAGTKVLRLNQMALFPGVRGIRVTY